MKQNKAVRIGPMEFRRIPIFDGTYYASENGMIRRWVDDPIRPSNGTWVGVPQYDGIHARLRDNKGKIFNLRRDWAVASAWVENKNGGQFVKHKNGNIYDCRKDNLCWSREYQKRNSRMKVEMVGCGSVVRSWNSVGAAAKELNVNKAVLVDYMMSGKLIGDRYTIRFVKNDNKNEDK